MTLRSLDPSVWIPTLTLGCALWAGCDLESKSVTATASDSNGDDGGGSDGGGSAGDGAGDGLSATSQGDGGSSPADGGDGGTPDDEPLCLESVTQILDSEEVTPLGFPAEDIISLSNGWGTSFGWLPPDGPVTVVPAGTETELELGLTYTGGAIRFVSSEPNPDNHLDIVPQCDDRLEIEFELSFHTLDERFDETFTTVLSATQADAAEFRQRFEPDGFAGTFSSAEVAFDDDNGSVQAFELRGSFGAAADPTGSLFVEVELSFGEGPDSGSVGFGVIATWPAGSMGV